MKKIITLFIFILFIINTVQAQKVGLVLSGGGAKGLTHIGIIRALEENNIPIDYVAGTSMGAIVSALYAMGYSPDEMEELIKSDNFKRWYSGEIEEKYMYYFKKNLPTPDFINVHLSLHDSLSIKPQILPSSVVDPIQMNLVFLDLFARANASCGGDFDKLFVPFRCVASDVYNKKQLIMRNGDLGDAVRASMSFPFMFKPIEINGILAYDGGIYNNFPTDVMMEDFHPDIIIGSSVSSNPTKPDEKDLMGQVENMIMQKTDYSIPDSLGFVMQFRFTDVGLMDFQRVDELSKLGYNRTMGLMDSIKSRIHRRVNYDNVRLRRLVYRSNFPELRFKNIIIEGANSQQQAYIKKEFHSSDNKEFSYEDVKRGYFRILSGSMISEIIPHAVFNPTDNTYDLRLKVKMGDNINLRVGGSVSTTSSNQIYLGINYQDLNYYAKEITLDGQLGKIYNNIQLMGRMDFATAIPTSYRLIASVSKFDYFKREKLFSHTERPALNQKDERFVKLQVALPFRSNKRAEFSVGYGRIEDEYFQSNVFNFETDKLDMSTYKLFGGTISFNGSTLNTRQYPTAGAREALVAQIFTGKEYFNSGIDSLSAEISKKQSWLQISYMMEKYNKLSEKWTMGWYVKALYASRNFSQNYQATMMQAGEFTPTPHSQLYYNPAFRANQYVAAGIKPIFRFNNMLHLRGEFYGFLPVYPILCNENNKAYYGRAFSHFEYMGEVSLVFHLPFGSVAAYVNHYSSPKKEWNVGLTLGWQLFNYRFIE